MRNAAVSLLMMVGAVVLAILLIGWLWPVINGLFWTVILGALLGFIAFLLVEQRIQNQNGAGFGGGSAFGLPQQMLSHGWSLVTGVVVFLIVLVIGFNITMTVWNTHY